MASESSFYRVLQEHHHQQHEGGRSQVSKRKVATTHTAPGQASCGAGI